MTVLVTDQRRYAQGVPCWVDTEQPDPPEAASFYAGLFGWELTQAMPPGSPGTYLVATLDGHDVAAVGPSDGTATWNTYVACADPTGAVFRLWQARRRLGSQVVNVADTWNFSDLATPDPDRALAFYAQVFGWQVSDDLGAGMIRLPGYGDHLAATIDPGIRERQAKAPAGFADVVAGLVVTDGPPGWWVRFTVADRDASAATAERLGARVVSSADTAWTREAVIRDPQGAELILSQFAPPG